MKLRHLALVGACLACFGSLGASQAMAAPAWNLDLHHAPTNFSSASPGEYWIEVNNVGATASSGLTTLTVKLPSGLSRQSVRINRSSAYEWPLPNWSCPGSVGDATVVCTTSDPIRRHSVDQRITLAVNVQTALPSRTVSAELKGGGAPVAVSAKETTPIGSPAPFGIIPETFTPDFFEADGLTTERAAGGHPDLFTVPFDFNTVDAPDPVHESPLQKAPTENIRNLSVDLPPGFIGNPTAVGECSAAQFNVGECPPNSQVGRVDVQLYPFLTPTADTQYRTISSGVFNLKHPRGAIADLAFAVVNNPVHVKVSLDPANRYAIRSVVSDINETVPAFGQRLTLWGTPSDPSHDSERCPSFVVSGNNAGDTSEECAIEGSRKPFISMPAQCDDDNVFRLHHYDSWENSGSYGPEIDYTIPGRMKDCNKPRFEPNVAIEPTGKQANSPTGLEVHIKVAQNENPDAVSSPPVKSTVVTLPEGMSFSPSFADGLQSCTLAQMKLGTNDAVQCPDASRIGEVELHSPLLPKSAEGSMYLAAQGDNPYGSTFAVLLVLEDTEERGILIKVPGRLDVDPVTGQIKTVFDDLPQFPFDDMTLKFRSGPRAPLVNPPSCGKQTIGVRVTSYAQPQKAIDVSSTYDITEGPGGTPCPPDAARRPFSPKFSGGTLNPVAGSYSPFVFRLSRDDSEQELSRVTTILPPGLVAKIAGVPFCPDQLIASISGELGTGAAEARQGTCPAASQIGTISAGLGAGPGPNYFPGKVYLAGPYKGAPLSLAIVAPGLAGPFDLGNVVVRAALYVDPDTTQVRAVSDPFPTILHGVILRVRDVRVAIDRPQTTINPTSCSPMSVGGQISGLGGALFNASAPFQVGSCADLPFAPKLGLRLFGGTRRGSHPKFRATLAMPVAGANIARASVALPHSEFLDQSHIRTICTRVQFAAGACPQGSIYGTVSVKTPLLDETLTGNIYLRSSSNPLPDLVAAFRGGRIDANLVGRIDSANGGIRNTFEFVPDVPVTEASFNFFGGSKGLLQNSRDICKSRPRATARFSGQNGAEVTRRPLLRAACGKARKKAAKKPARPSGRRQG